MVIVEQEAKIERLVWFIHLRWAALLGGGVILLAGPLVFPFQVAYGPIVLCLAVLAVLNGTYFSVWNKLKRSVSAGIDLEKSGGNLLHLQMAGDFLILTALLYFSGGAGNPLVLFYLFHLAIGAYIFPVAESFFYVPLAIALPWMLYALQTVQPSIADFWGPAGGPSLGYERAFLIAYSVAVAGLWIFLSRLSLDVRIKEWKLSQKTTQLKEAKEGLEQLDVFKNQFLHQLAAQLKTPTLEVETHLAQLEKKLPEYLGDDKESVREARRHVRVLESTIDDLLWLSRLQVEDVPLKKETIEVYKTVLSRIQAQESRAKARGISFRLHGGSDIRLSADKAAFEQVMDNLLSNAVKYSPEKGGPVTVEIEVKPDWLVVSVQDEGIGIPVSQQKKIFGEFFRASNAQAKEKFGTGLGLTIVQRVLAWHGGKVALDSQAQKGTRVETWWPLLSTWKETTH